MDAGSPTHVPNRAAEWFRWPLAVLAILLFVDVWYRAHTFGPTITAATRLNLWPAAVGASEPLDCDEAAYAYIGHRLLRGDVMYRDLTENKPPLGYWLYATGVALGGYNELAIRLLPIPFLLATIGLLFWLGRKLAGPVCACLAAGLYVLLSTDPYLFGNGSNMEHFMNFFSVASLALVCHGLNQGERRAFLAAGVCLGAGTLVKQVAILPLAVYFVAMMAGRGGGSGVPARSRVMRLADFASLVLGMVLIVSAAVLVLIARGAGPSAYEDILRYGKAMATDTLPEPHQPAGMIRWLTGNADPAGKLPWPFGSTNYLVWWGTGSWPLWLVAVPCVAQLLFGRGHTAAGRLVAGWTIAAALQVVLPGLYWPHYYLLPTPGIALVLATALASSLRCLTVVAGSNQKKHRPRLKMMACLASALLLAAAIVATLVIQVRSYLLVQPQELTVRYKGGSQWVVLRALGEELSMRSVVWSDPRLYVWGWQSPLHFYAKLDGATRHFFVDNLLRDQAERDHPLIKPRIAEIMRALRDRPPALIFAGYAPFPELSAFLRERYLPSRLVPSRNGLGLWVDRARFAAFENFPAERRGSSSGQGRGLGRSAGLSVDGGLVTVP
jgi:4-amino-4-deoxy-L-arabinose transferase-like glycosyltransferase